MQLLLHHVQSPPHVEHDPVGKTFWHAETLVRCNIALERSFCVSIPSVIALEAAMTVSCIRSKSDIDGSSP